MKYMIARWAVFFWAFSLIANAGFSQDKLSVARFSPPAIPPDKGYFVQEIRGGVYWVTDGLYTTMFIVSSAGVIAVDPLPPLGARYLKAIRDVTARPTTHVVYSTRPTDAIGVAVPFPT